MAEGVRSVKGDGEIAGLGEVAGDAASGGVESDGGFTAGGGSGGTGAGAAAVVVLETGWAQREPDNTAAVRKRTSWGRIDFMGDA